MDCVTLSHFSSKPISRALLERRGQGIDHKPHGFWVSVDGEDDWESWCRAEGFSLPRLAIRHRVTLRPNANVLLLKTVAAIDSFHRRYSAELAPGIGDYIDWRTVCLEYDGIIIAPYQWKRRHDGAASRWYYGWDCASGCIWHPRAVANIEVIASQPVASEETLPAEQLRG